MIGRNITCPVTVSETGCIRIVADATKALGSPFTNYKWEYKAIVYDPIKEVRIGQAFDVTKREIEQWMKS